MQIQKTFKLFVCLIITLFLSCSERKVEKITVPIRLDHNRMLVDAEIQKPDNSWRKVLLWVDTGNPDFFISEELAFDLGIDLSNKKDSLGNDLSSLKVNSPSEVKIGGKLLDFDGVNTVVVFSPKWLFNTMHVDANLPSTVLQKYFVVFDYPEMQLTIADSGTIEPEGKASVAIINPKTGIIQTEAMVEGDSISFALDNGASYSIISVKVMERLSDRNPKWPRHKGAVGCANIWGWWQGEQNWQLIRIPEIKLSSVVMNDVGVIGLPQIMNWYSQKTAKPVDGILGANALKSLRIEIDYKNSRVYFKSGISSNGHDLDLVGLTIRLEDDGNYSIVGVCQKDGKSSVEGVEPGDLLLQVDDFIVKGETMGKVVDALRGRPGDHRELIIEKEGKQYHLDAKVERFL